MFSLSATDIDQARAIAAGRYGTDRQITVRRKSTRIEAIDAALMEQASAEEEAMPMKEYLGKVWLDGQPVIRFRLMARGPIEASALAEARYGKHPMSVWNVEDRHQLR